MPANVMKSPFWSLLSLSLGGIFTCTWVVADSLQLSLTDAMNLAVKNNLKIQSQRLKLSEVQTSYDYAFSQAFPNLLATAAATHQKAAVNTNSPLFGGDPYNAYSLGLKLTQPLYAGGALTSGIASARADDAIQSAELARLERDTQLQVYKTYFEVLLNQNLIETLKNVQKVQTESLITAEKYQKIGRGQLLDVLQIKTQLALLKPQIETSQNNRLRAAAELATLLHEGELHQITLADSIQLPQPSQVAEALARDSHELAELKKNESLIMKLAADSDLQLASHWPYLNLIGTANRTAFDKKELFEDYSTSWSLGIQLSVPLFSGLSSKYQKSALGARTLQAETERVALSDQLILAKFQASRNADTTFSVLNSSQEAVQLAQSAYREAERSYRVQTIGFFQYQSVQQNWLDAQIALQNAQYNYLLALGQNFIASGHPLQDLIELMGAKK